MTYEPFKCPDCKVWWRTATHKCEDTPVKISVTKDSPYSPGLKKGWIYCPSCQKPISRYDWHTCKSYDKLHNEHYKDNKKGPHEPEIDPPRWNA